MMTTDPEVAGLLERLEEQLRRGGIDVDSRFRPPASLDNILSTFDKVKFEPTAGVIEMYRWHDGCADVGIAGKRFPVNFHTFLSVDEAFQETIYDIAIHGETSHGEELEEYLNMWALFTDNGAPWIDLSSGERRGQIVASPYGGVFLRECVRKPSLASLIGHWVDCIDRDLYAFTRQRNGKVLFVSPTEEYATERDELSRKTRIKEAIWL